MQALLAQLVSALAGGSIKIVDLTQALGADTPVIPLPPTFGQAWPFKLDEISSYDDRGPAWYWNNFSCSEHTGTHFDAPIHWVSGKDHSDGATDTIPPHKFIAPACVIDVTGSVAQNNDYLLTVDEILAWEKTHGPIPAQTWVLMRTDWSKRMSAQAFLNVRDDGAHTPGPHPDLVPFLIRERDVIGFGNEAVGTDAGQAFTFAPTPFPCHHGMHGNNRFGLASLAHLDLLPPTGAVVIAAPLKIVRGSGSPCRVLALVPA